MKTQYIGLEHIDGPLVYLKTPEGIAFNDQVELILKDGSRRLGNVIVLNEDVTVIQVYEGTDGISIEEVRTELKGEPLKVKLSKSCLGRVFNGVGKPIDGLGEINDGIRRDINGSPMNPISRQYPRNYIETGISVIDGLMTLIRGQKLPIFSGSGIDDNKLTEQIIRQANIRGDGEFAIVFGLMGAEYETAEFDKQRKRYVLL